MEEPKSNKLEKQCECCQCGWIGDFSSCYKGEFEPSTCVMCEGPVVVIISKENKIKD